MNCRSTRCLSILIARLEIRTYTLFCEFNGPSIKSKFIARCLYIFFHLKTFDEIPAKVNILWKKQTGLWTILAGIFHDDKDGDRAGISRSVLCNVTYTTRGQLSIYTKDLLYLEAMTSNDVYYVKPYLVILIMLWKSMNLFKIQPYIYSGLSYVLELNFLFNVFLSSITQGF